MALNSTSSNKTSGRRNHFALWRPLLYLSAAGIFFFFAAGTLYQSSALVSRSVKTQGTVIQVEPRREFDAKGNYRTGHVSSIRFIPASKEAQIFQTTGKYTLGAFVPVIYNPQNPKEAQILSLSGLWLAPLLSGLSGLCLAIAGLLSLLSRLERRKMLD